MKLAEVKILHPCHNIVAMLRKAAEDIEKGEHGEAVDALFILETADGVKLFAWGQTDFKRSLGLLEMGRAELFQVWEVAKRMVR